MDQGSGICPCPLLWVSHSRATRIQLLVIVIINVRACEMRDARMARGIAESGNGIEISRHTIQQNYPIDI